MPDGTYLFERSSNPELRSLNCESLKEYSGIGLHPICLLKDTNLKGYICCSGYDLKLCGVMVIVTGIGHGDTSSNPGLIAFHIALIPLGKV